MLARHLKDAPSPVHYVAGPPPMVSGLVDLLEESGIDGVDIRSEDFSGY